MKDTPGLPIGDALRLLRIRLGLTQTAASKKPGAPDFRTLSHWETRRKAPSLPLLARYLESLDLDFADLQDALDQARGGDAKAERVIRRLDGEVEALCSRLEGMVGRMETLDERVTALEPISS